MSFTQLRAFHAVVEHKGFTAAATALNVSQSTITMQVGALEKRYNVELFHRQGRVVVPTQSGETLHRITARLMQAHRDSLEFLEASEALETGTLRIAAVGPIHATEMISMFKTRYPGVELKVKFGNSQETLEALLGREADIAITADVSTHPAVVMERYSDHQVVVFVHKAHRFFKRDSILIAELHGEPVVLREEGSTTRRAFETALARHKVKIDRAMEIGSREGVWRAVRLGLGIGVVADFEFVPAPELRAITISDVDIRTNYFVAYLKNRENAPLIRAFLKLYL
jgi:LysR family transcriptional regulator, low CO2-responsive transcriptional regulator